MRRLIRRSMSSAVSSTISSAMSSALMVAATGAALGFTLVVAIRAQNTFVLRQGLRREHVGAIVLLCAGCDAVLMTAC